MFTKDSRYAEVPTVTVRDAEGREVAAVKLRALGVPVGADLTVAGSDQLDVIADRCYRDGTKFWHVADANSEVDSRDILNPVGRVVKVPES